MKRPPWRCSDCRKPPIRFIEHGNITHTREVDPKTGELEREGINKEGNITHVTAHCRCGNVWRLRGVVHMGEVEERFGIEAW